MLGMCVLFSPVLVLYHLLILLSCLYTHRSLLENRPDHVDVLVDISIHRDVVDIHCISMRN
jgi:hypothetical protein